MKSTPESKKENGSGQHGPGKHSKANNQPSGLGRPEPRINSQTRIYPKLEVGAANDPAEREADLAAEQVLRGGKVITGTGGAPADQPGALRMKANSAAQGGMAAPTSVESKINSKRGKGSALPKPLQQKLSHTFGTDFSGVSVHTDGASHGMNAELGAKAFTQGSDMFFGKGQYAPGTPEGDRLIAHEAAHVVQGGKSVRRKAEQRGGGEVGLPDHGETESKEYYLDSIVELLKITFERRFIDFPKTMAGHLNAWSIDLIFPEDGKKKSLRSILIQTLKDQTYNIVKGAILSGVDAALPGSKDYAEVGIGILEEWYAQPTYAPSANSELQSIKTDIYNSYEALARSGEREEHNNILAAVKFKTNLSGASITTVKRAYNQVKETQEQTAKWYESVTNVKSAFTYFTEQYMLSAKRKNPDPGSFGSSSHVILSYGSGLKRGTFGYKGTPGSFEFAWTPYLEQSDIDKVSKLSGFTPIPTKGLLSFLGGMTNEDICNAAAAIRNFQVLQSPSEAIFVAPNASMLLKPLQQQFDNFDFDDLDIPTRIQLIPNSVSMDIDSNGQIIKRYSWSDNWDYHWFILEVLFRDQGFPVVNIQSDVITRDEQFSYY